MADEKDAKLATALRAAKQQSMYFAFVAVGSTDGVLMVSKKKVPVKDINDAKAESGGKKVFRGRCQMVDGKMTFETAKEPPSTMAKQLKAVIHASAGMMLQVEARMAPDLADEEEGGENEAEENESASPPPAPPPPPGGNVSGQVPPAPPPPPDAGGARFAMRFKAIAPIMQKLEGNKSAAAKDAKVALSEANAFFRKNDFANANDTLDIVEGLIKDALAAAGQGGQVPPAPPQPSQQDPEAVRFAARLKALAPIVSKAEATGSDFARQAKVQIAEGNKFYIAKEYNDANAALDKAEGLIKQAFAGTSQPSQRYAAALATYQSARTQAVGRLSALAKEVGAEPHPSAAKAQMEVRAVAAQLTEAPATLKQAISLESYLMTDDVVFEVCQLEYDFRTPLLKAIEDLKASLTK